MTNMMTAGATRPTSTTSAVSFENVTKEYRSKGGTVQALRGLNLDIPRGLIYGILGPNGAGKSTSLEIAVGLRHATSGVVRTVGLDPVTQAKELHTLVSTQPQNAKLFELLTVSELLDIWRCFYAKPVDPASLIAMLDMGDYSGRPVGRLSGGQRQRVNLALSLVGNVTVTILDEPSTGLDPIARADLWQALRSLRQQGITVIMSTHSMEEADALCDRVAIIDAGRCVAEGTPAELVAGVGKHRQISFKVPGGMPSALRDELARLGSITTSPAQDAVVMMTERSDETLRVLGRTQQVQDIWIVQPSLSDAFFKAAGRHFDQAEDTKHITGKA